MRRLTRRQQVLGGALLLAVVVGAGDFFLRGGQPREAAGSTAPPPPPARSPEWQDIDHLMTRLTQRSYASVADELDRMHRDLFMPDTALQAVIRQAASADAGTEELGPAEQQAAALAEFKAAHRLSGVVLGSRPLAIVDGQLLPVGAGIDGYRLVEIRRDRVRFEKPGLDAVVVLELECAAGPENGAALDEMDSTPSPAAAPPPESASGSS